MWKKIPDCFISIILILADMEAQIFFLPGGGGGVAFELTSKEKKGHQLLHGWGFEHKPFGGGGIQNNEANKAITYLQARTPIDPPPPSSAGFTIYKKKIMYWNFNII